jgi:hypothetical protein
MSKRPAEWDRQEQFEDIVEHADDDRLAGMLHRIESAIEDSRRIADNSYLATEAELTARRAAIDDKMFNMDSFASHREVIRLTEELETAVSAVDVLEAVLHTARDVSAIGMKKHREVTRPMSLERRSICNQLNSLKSERKRKRTVEYEKLLLLEEPE